MDLSLDGFRGADGGAIHTVTFTGDGNGADVVLVHGYAEHSLRYRHVAAALVVAGYDVHALDQHGHGRSGGTMGYVPSFDHLVDDVVTFATSCHREGRPLFLLGHSMGALVAMHTAASRRLPLAAVVSSGLVIRPAVAVPALLQRAAPIVSMLLPKLPTVTLDAKDISTLPAEVRAYDEDPFNSRGAIPARTGNEITAAGERLWGRLDDIDVPVLLLHGGDDALAAVSGSVDAAAALGDRATLQVFAGSYHEIFNDRDADAAIAAAIAFLDAHRG